MSAASKIRPLIGWLMSFWMKENKKTKIKGLSQNSLFGDFPKKFQLILAPNF